jgi:hypothetical protein
VKRVPIPISSSAEGISFRCDAVTSWAEGRTPGLDVRPRRCRLRSSVQVKTERFFKPEIVNGLNETGDGAIKTFTLRGIKKQPPYLHGGRLLTLDDTVEFFNLVLGTKLTPQEKQDLVAFLADPLAEPPLRVASMRAAMSWEKIEARRKA